MEEEAKVDGNGPAGTARFRFGVSFQPQRDRGHCRPRRIWGNRDGVGDASVGDASRSWERAQQDVSGLLRRA